MNPDNEHIIGIVGGMGPQAGIALFNSILNLTKAKTDQQHFPVILMSFPKQIVDRTLFLEGVVSSNPAYAIAAIIEKLEAAGAGIAGIACNTSHSPEIYNVIVEKLQKINSRIRLLHMPLETVLYIKKNYPQARRIGLLTTNGTYKSGLYKNLLKERGYEVVIPSFEFQNHVIHRMIYDPEFGIKASPQNITRQVRELAVKALQFFQQQKADAIILGCTELSLLVAKNILTEITIVDSTECLAKALIREADSFPVMSLPAMSQTVSNIMG